MRASWRTGLAGLFAGLSILIGQASAVVDSDPATNLDLSIVIATIAAMVAAFSARDNVVTSEQAGAKR
jgi:hypothetical protein